MEWLDFGRGFLLGLVAVGVGWCLKLLVEMKEEQEELREALTVIASILHWDRHEDKPFPRPTLELPPGWKGSDN